MTYVFYGIEACDTTKKARTRLDEHKAAYDFHDYKAVGIDREHLRRWCAEHGWQAVFNRTGTTFRKLDEAQKADPDEAKTIELMLAQPSMIKRLVLELGGRTLVGFKPDVYAAAPARAGGCMSVVQALFVPTCFALNLASGPNNLPSLNNVARHGSVIASLAGGGRLLTLAGMLALVASGLALMLHTSAWLFLAIKLPGAVYLLWLVLQLWRADAQLLTNETSPVRPSLWRLGRQKLLVAAGNPKVILIFTTFLPQFVDPGQPLGAQFVQLGAAFLLLEWLAIALYSYAGLHFGRLLASQRAWRLFNRGCAALSGSVGLGPLPSRHLA